MNAINKVFDRVFFLQGKHNISIFKISENVDISRPTITKLIKEKKGTLENLNLILEFLESKEVL